MKKTATIKTDLICSECGNLFTIQRVLYKIRPKYHIKDLYCYKCDKTTKHIELRDIDIFKKYLQFSSELTEEEEKIKQLILTNRN